MLGAPGGASEFTSQMFFGEASNAVVLAKLQAAGFLPELWQPDAKTERLRRAVARRSHRASARASRISESG